MARTPAFAVAAVALAALLAGCGSDEARRPDRANFTTALNDYLAQRGHLCLGKYDWPITVAAGSRDADAWQMPVLEKVGFVAARPTTVARAGAAPLAAMQYALTGEGEKHYLHVPIVIRTSTRKVVHPADLCAATLTLDRLTGWDAPQTRDGRTATSLLFTYRIAPEDWARTPQVLQAFPVLARALEGEGTTQLRLGVHLTDRGWVADELDDLPPN